MDDVYGIPGKRKFLWILLIQFFIFVFLTGSMCFQETYSIFNMGEDLAFLIFTVSVWRNLNLQWIRLDYAWWKSLYQLGVLPSIYSTFVLRSVIGITVIHLHANIIYLLKTIFFMSILYGVVMIMMAILKVIKDIMQMTKNEKNIYAKLSNLEKKYGSYAMQRLKTSIDIEGGSLLMRSLPCPRGFFMTGLASKPWHDREKFFWTAALESMFLDIQGEADKVMQQFSHIQPYHYPNVSKKGWDSFMLIKNGEILKENWQLCPVTARALTLIPGFPNFREAMFSILQPNSTIDFHTDHSNIFLTLHFCLRKSDHCGINVGGEIRNWEEGNCYILDTSYWHSAWNKGRNARIVLLVDFLHPELTRAEQEFFSPQDLEIDSIYDGANANVYEPS